jgi:hypothetical protein
VAFIRVSYNKNAITIYVVVKKCMTKPLVSLLDSECMTVVMLPDEDHRSDSNMFVQNNMCLNIFVNVYQLACHVSIEHYSVHGYGTCNV